MSEAGRRRFSVPPPRDMDESPFAAILGEFVSRLPGAIAAALVDAEGETVDYVGKYDVYELKVMAAHFRILLGTVGVLVATEGAPSTLIVRGESRTVLGLMAKEGYAVVVVFRRRAGFARREIATLLLIKQLAKEADWAIESSPPWGAVEVHTDVRGRPLEIVFGGGSRTPVEVLGTFGTHGFRVRSDAGHEFCLVREPKNLWYADSELEPAALR